MADIIREYRESDRAEIIALWKEIFGDKEEYIAYFLDNLPSFGKAAAAECEGEVCAMASCIDGLTYCGRRVGYIYAVATKEIHRGRGLGAAVSRKAAELSGAEIITTFPAEESLYDWYGEILGLDDALHVRSVSVGAAEGCAVRAVSSEEYNEIREKLLENTPHVTLEPAAAALTEKLCTCYGGGLFACGENLLAAYVDGKTCLVREALGENAAAAAASLAAALGCETAAVRIASESGERFTAIPHGSMERKTVWNLAFD